MLQSVLKAMEQLFENDRLVLSLICIDGMSYKEASATLEIPLGTVMSRLARARHRLYALVNDNKKPMLKLMSSLPRLRNSRTYGRTHYGICGW